MVVGRDWWTFCCCPSVCTFNKGNKMGTCTIQIWMHLFIHNLFNSLLQKTVFWIDSKVTFICFYFYVNVILTSTIDAIYLLISFCIEKKLKRWKVEGGSLSIIHLMNNARYLKHLEYLDYMLSLKKDTINKKGWHGSNWIFNNSNDGFWPLKRIQLVSKCWHLWSQKKSIGERRWL